MAHFWEIPIKPAQPQTLTVALSNVNYGMYFKWFDVAKVWLVDIADANGNPIVVGVPLTTGSDLLSQYKHLGFVGELWCATDGNPDAQPTFETLGATSHLYYAER